MIITEALGVAIERCVDRDDFFRVLSTLNLLNAAIKDKRWKHNLSYVFINGRAAQIFEQWIINPVCGVRAFYNKQEGVVFFELDGAVFSYHRIRFSERIRSFIRSEANKPIEWNGARSQKIPVELFNLAMSS